jgi:MYXO-CTERM domain-containing protein
MKKIAYIALPALAVACAFASGAQAALVAGWTMPTAVAASTTGSNYTYGAANQGDQTTGSSLSGYHASTATAWSSPAGNGSTYALSSNNWAAGDYYQVTVDTRGYGDISVSWDQTRSSTGPSAFRLMMSVDGGTNFTTVNAGYSVVQAGLGGTGTTSWSTTGVAQSGFTTTTIAGSTAANTALVTFRFVNTSAVASAGTNRIDNILVTGTAVPAPGALALLGVAGLIGARRRR